MARVRTVEEEGVGLGDDDEGEGDEEEADDEDEQAQAARLLPEAADQLRALHGLHRSPPDRLSSSWTRQALARSRAPS